MHAQEQKSHTLAINICLQKGICQTHGRVTVKSDLPSLFEPSCHLIMKKKEKDTTLKGQLLMSKWLMTVHRNSLETPHRLKCALLSFRVLPSKNCVQNTF